jgi:antitoxin component of MazEF toxin-antitoxin module
MVVIESKIRKWGNSSFALVIPKKIAKQEHLKVNQKLQVLIPEQQNVLKETFGTLKHWKKPTEQIMREIDEELWPEDE